MLTQKYKKVEAKKEQERLASEQRLKQQQDDHEKLIKKDMDALRPVIENWLKTDEPIFPFPANMELTMITAMYRIVEEFNKAEPDAKHKLLIDRDSDARPPHYFLRFSEP